MREARALSNASEGFGISKEEYRRVSELVHATSGICLADSKQALVLSRLSRRLRELRIGTFSEYLDLVENSEGGEELNRMISSLTTNVTRFFREEHHFTRLRELVLPPLLERARRGGRVRIWSAGCSTGEEPYSIATTVLGMCPDAGALDLRILATDIDPEVVETAIKGSYGDQANTSIPEKIAEKYFQKSAGDRLEVGPSVRSLVAFRVLNLLAPWPFRGQFDVVFCRNVVIYFDGETRNRLWRRFAEVIPADGHLFIGHSERISSECSELFLSDGVTSYIRARSAYRGHSAPEVHYAR